MPDNTEPTVESTTEPTTEPAQPAEDALPDEVKAILRKERKARRDAETAAAAAHVKVQQFEDRDKTETQKQQDRIASLEQENKRLQLENLRRDVATEKGLPANLAKRLNGATREELEADAEDLLTTIPNTPQQQRKPAGDAGQGFRGNAPQSKGQLFAEVLAQARGR